MVKSGCLTFNPSFGISEIIDTLSILINIALAVFVIITIQKGQNDQRVLKDIFIKEILDVREQYSNLYNKLFKGTLNADDIKSWFKLMNIKLSSIEEILVKQYSVDANLFNPYKSDLRELITENENYIAQYNSSDGVSFDKEFKNELFKFHSTNCKIFITAITKINNK